MKSLNALNGYMINSAYNYKEKIKKQNKNSQSNIGFGAPIKSVKLYKSEAKNYNTIDFTHDIFKKFSDVAPKLSDYIRDFFKSVNTKNRTFMDAFDEAFEKNKDESIVEDPDRLNSYCVCDLGVMITKLGKNCVDLSETFSKNEDMTVFVKVQEDAKEPATIFAADEGAKIEVESDDKSYNYSYHVTTFRNDMTLPMLAKTMDDLVVEKKMTTETSSQEGESITKLVPHLNFCKVTKGQQEDIISSTNQEYEETIEKMEEFDATTIKKESGEKLVLKWNSDEAKRFDEISNQQVNKLLDGVREVEGVLSFKNKSDIKASNLTEINGGLYLEKSKNIDLSNLEKVEGSIIRDLESEVILNDELEKKALDYEFGIKRENGKVILDLNNLGDSKLFAYRDDRQLNLLFSDMTTINGDFGIMGRKNLNFNKLEEINGELILKDVSDITFPSLKAIDGELKIEKSSKIDLSRLERLYGDYSSENASDVLLSKKMNEHIKNKQKLKKEELLRDKEKELQVKLMQAQIDRVQGSFAQENDLLKLRKEELEKNEQLNEKMLAIKKEEFEAQMNIQRQQLSMRMQEFEHERQIQEQQLELRKQELNIQKQQLEFMKAQAKPKKQGVIDGIMNVAKGTTTVANGINSVDDAIGTVVRLVNK